MGESKGSSGQQGGNGAAGPLCSGWEQQELAAAQADQFRDGQ